MNTNIRKMSIVTLTYSSISEHKYRLTVPVFDGLCAAGAGKQVATCDDHTVSWLETRPGERHSKTGIPPALATLTLQDFLDKPGNTSLPSPPSFALTLQFDATQ